jgi:mRNA interferase MazF
MTQQLSSDLAVGDVVIVYLPAHDPKGREQEGARPAIVIAIPWEPMRYPAILIAPVSSQIGSWVAANPSLYPVLPAGTGGLRLESVVLLDQVRTIDRRRLGDYLGSMNAQQYQPIYEGLARLLLAKAD